MGSAMPPAACCTIADLYGVSADRIVGECYGLNHLSFFRSIKIDGKEIMRN